MIPPLEAGLRLLLAALLGGIIGWERESHHRPAGLRTHVLVSVGSALFTLTSLEFASFGGPTDPSRIASQIVSGIGFLGAGTIIRSGDSDTVRGLTTAASIWLTAAVGMAVGSGLYIISAVSTVVALVILRLLPKGH